VTNVVDSTLEAEWDEYTKSAKKPSKIRRLQGGLRYMKNKRTDTVYIRLCQDPRNQFNVICVGMNGGERFSIAKDALTFPTVQETERAIDRSIGEDYF